MSEDIWVRYKCKYCILRNSQSIRVAPPKDSGSCVGRKEKTGKSGPHVWVVESR